MNKIYSKLSKILSNKYLALILIIFLSLLWVGLSLIFNKQTAFSVLRYGYDYKPSSVNQLMKGEQIKGEFVSKNNYLGIVYLRFDDFVKTDYLGEDILQFRIKEKGQKNWHYLNNYRTGILKTSLLFPFGFPTITDAKEKTYTFEIESLDGNKQNGVKLSDQQPILLSAHQLTHQEIFGSKKRIVNYFFTKWVNSFTSTDFLLSSVLYAFPLFIYLFWLLIVRKLDLVEQSLATTVLLLMLLDILFLKQTYLGILLVLIIGWISAVKINKLHSSVSLMLSFIIICLWVCLTIFGIADYNLKLNIWAYFLIVIGIIQILLEHRFKSLGKVDYKTFISRFINIK